MDFSPTKRGVHLRLPLVHYSGREGKRSSERNLNNQNGFSFIIVVCLFIYLFGLRHFIKRYVNLQDNILLESRFIWIVNSYFFDNCLSLIYTTTTTLSQFILTLFRPDLVTWRSYMGWFRPWPVGIGLKKGLVAVEEQQKKIVLYIEHQNREFGST